MFGSPISANLSGLLTSHPLPVLPLDANSPAAYSASSCAEADGLTKLAISMSNSLGNDIGKRAPEEEFAHAYSIGHSETAASKSLRNTASAASSTSTTMTDDALPSWLASAL